MAQRIRESGLLRTIAQYLEVRVRGREVTIKPGRTYASTLEFGSVSRPPVRIFDSRKSRAKRSR